MVTKEFGYTGNYQTYVIPSSGVYKLEVWGASGGDSTSGQGGRGGYSVGNINLKKGDTLYIYIGGTTTTQVGGFNGGGAGTGSGYSNKGGGGATDIRKGGSNLYNRIIVAGGGGGGAYNGGPNNGHIGGYGGGTYGGSGNGNNNDEKDGGKGGGPSSGGAGGAYGGSYSVGFPGSIGLGGAGATTATGSGGGGGGWYGGGGGSWGGGGGGSGYIGSLLNAKTLNGSQVIPNITGSTEVGHTGHGYAIISSSNNPPSKPSNLIGIKQGENILTYSDITVSWNASTDSEGDAITYLIEFFDGSKWIKVAEGIKETTKTFKINHRDTVYNSKIRITAVDAQDGISEPLESPTFTLAKILILIEDNKKYKTFKNSNWTSIK